MKRMCIWLLFVYATLAVSAQEYVGITGMVHVPTAEMATEGEARIGAFFLNSHFLPERLAERKYNTFNHFLAIAPFSWIEISYACTLMKSSREGDYDMKDRTFNAKIRPLKEGKRWPALAIGMNDIGHTPSNEELGVDGAYFQNIYLAASKHLLWRNHEFGFHLAYRYYTSDYNVKWRGIAGGITYRPAFAKNFRAMIEYTAEDVNIGADCRLWKYLFLQASLQNGKYFTGGVCLKINLLGKKPF